MTRVAYGCVTNSLERVQRWVLPRIGDRSLTLLWNQTSMTSAYNQIIDSHDANPPDALVLIHDDLELVDPRAEEKFLEALAFKNVGVVGVAGGFDIDAHGLAWWNARTVGHQLTDSGPLDFGSRTGFVTSLEGSVMALGPWAIHELRFDETFTGFHGYDDIGMSASMVHNRRVYVADVDTHHHTTVGFDSPESERAWLEADRQFRAKWSLGGVSDPASHV
jgi:hypothetical protein